MEMIRVERLIREKKKVKQVGLNQLLAVIEGQTIPSLFPEVVILLKLVAKQLEEANFKSKEDVDDIEVEHPFVRKLTQILSLATLHPQMEKEENRAEAAFA